MVPKPPQEATEPPRCLKRSPLQEPPLLIHINRQLRTPKLRGVVLKVVFPPLNCEANAVDTPRSSTFAGLCCPAYF